jgi:HK97 family phage prohead protease
VDLGPFVEVIRPGAFKRALASNPDVCAFVNHNEDLMLGRTTAGTLKLAEDDRGLKVDIAPAPTQVGKDAVENVRLGNYSGMSFAFRAVTEKWDSKQQPPLRELFDVDLFDVSVVAYPAYPKTEVGLRALARLVDQVEEEPEAAARRRRLEVLELELGVEPRKTTPFVDLPIHPDRNRSYEEDQVAPRVRKWASSDGSGDKDKIDWNKLRRAFFWSDPEKKKDFGGYKLKFADVADGQLVAVARGIFLCAAVMQGARGGIDIPDADRDGVKAHIAKYYAKCRKAFDDDSIVPPWEQ